MTRERGVTLLEVMVAISLLALLSIAVLTSMRMGLNALGRTNTRLVSNRKVAGAQRMLEHQLAGFMPVIAACAPSGAPRPFFLGEPQTMRFVSTYSIQEGTRGMPRILEFQVIPRDRGRGLRLVVNEHLYSGPMSAGLFCSGPMEIGPQSFVLADALSSCRFVYQEPLPLNQGGGRWVERWDLPKYPSAVRVEITPLEDDAIRLRPVTVHAWIHVNRYPIFDYVDY